jgi:hypothetical protein
MGARSRHADLFEVNMRARAIPSEFRPPALIARILAGGADSDPVRLHGAIVAAFEVHGQRGARRDVLYPAIAAARKLDAAARDTIAQAIHDHLVHQG